MLWGWWSSLAASQQSCIIISVPILLILMDIVAKDGFGLSADTAGSDLCLAAASLDVTHAFVTAGAAGVVGAPSLLLTLLLLHVFLWASSLRLVSLARGPSLSARLLVGSSYGLGVLALFTSLGTIIQLAIAGGGV